MLFVAGDERFAIDAAETTEEFERLLYLQGKSCKKNILVRKKLFAKLKGTFVFLRILTVFAHWRIIYLGVEVGWGARWGGGGGRGNWPIRMVWLGLYTFCYPDGDYFSTYRSRRSRTVSTDASAKRELRGLKGPNLVPQLCHIFPFFALAQLPQLICHSHGNAWSATIVFSIPLWNCTPSPNRYLYWGVWLYFRFIIFEKYFPLLKVWLIISHSLCWVFILENRKILAGSWIPGSMIFWLFGFANFWKIGAVSKMQGKIYVKC